VICALPGLFFSESGLLAHGPLLFPLQLLLCRDLLVLSQPG
jgi:hypothetical protein